MNPNLPERSLNSISLSFSKTPPKTNTTHYKQLEICHFNGRCPFVQIWARRLFLSKISLTISCLFLSILSLSLLSTQNPSSRYYLMCEFPLLDHSEFRSFLRGFFWFLYSPVVVLSRSWSFDHYPLSDFVFFLPPLMGMPLLEPKTAFLYSKSCSSLPFSSFKHQVERFSRCSSCIGSFYFSLLFYWQLFRIIDMLGWDLDSVFLPHLVSDFCSFVLW